MKAILYFAPLFGRFRTPLLVGLALSLVTLAAGIGLLGVSGWFLTAAALTGAGAAFNLFGPSSAIRGLSFIRILSRYGEKLAGHDATLRLLSDLRQWLFARLFPLLPLRGALGRSEMVSRLLADVDALDTVFLLALGPIAAALLAGLSVTVLLALVLPAAAPVYLLAFVAAALLVPVLLTVAARRPGRAVATASAELRRHVLDGIDGHFDLRVTGALPAALQDIDSAAAALARPRRAVGSIGAIAGGAVQILAALALLSTLVAGGLALEAAAIDGPWLVGVLLAVLASFEATSALVRSTTRLAVSAAAAERLRDLAETAPAIVAPAAPAPLPAGFDLSLIGVSYGHDPAHPVLHDIDLSIPEGAVMAVTGPSGSGKSTLASLLLRLADPQAGQIRLGGTELAALDPAALWRRIALMPQQAPVFLDTVRNNLLIGRADADDAALWAALEAARLEAFVMSLPQGLDTPVGEAGQTLSVGQARRLCLARTLLADAAITVLDEPTSGLDPEAEAAFLAELPALAKGRTMVVITHAAVPAGYTHLVRLRAGRIEGAVSG